MTQHTTKISLLDRPERIFIVGVVALVLAAFGSALGAHQFFAAYLFAYLVILGIALGSMAIVMLHHLVGGAWGFLIRRLGEAAAATIPLLTLLALPLMLGQRSLFPWARPDEVADEPLLQMRQTLFSPHSVWFRAAIFFIIWNFLALRLRSLSLQLDAGPSKSIDAKLQRLSAVGLIIYFITMSLASVDWIASREVHWYSSTFGLIVVVGQALAALSFLLLMLLLLRNRSPIAETIEADTLHDLGNLLLTLVILWAYISFAQLLVIWMGNSQEDNIWFVHRSQGIWLVISIVLIVLHFFVPFLLLLQQGAKRRIALLGSIGAALLVLRFLDNLWMVAPSAPDAEAGHASWIDLLTPIGLGGIWFAAFLWTLRGHPLIPLHQTEEHLEHDVAQHSTT